MARVVNFPLSATETLSRNRGIRSSAATLSTVPSAFLQQVEAVKSMELLEGVRYSEIPTPRCVADYSFGVELLLEGSEQENKESGVISGWVMTNYSREKVAEWDSNWRLTGYFRQPVVNEEENSLISQMYWDYAYGVLTPIAVGSVSGAVTNAKNEFFDSAISSDLSGAVTSCEIRASWSPVLVENSADIPGHISAWAELMLRAAGKRVVLRGKKAALQ